MRIVEQFLRGLLSLLSVVIAAYGIYLLVLALPQSGAVVAGGATFQPNPFQGSAAAFVNSSMGALLTGIGWLLAAIFLQLLLMTTKMGDTRGLGDEIVSLRSMVANVGRLLRDRP